ncbi:MAG: 2-oxo acid dehydrogenase subunit E2, partial [Planctomycetota bacterium]
ETQQQVVYKQYINLALGVHTDRGLIAPIIRDADRMGVRQLNEALIELAERARTARFGVNDLRGGTFTISNAGAMGGSRYSTPIINPPQVAVLALGRTHWQPMVVDGEVVPRFVMPISLSFDHRVIDGGTEIAFQADLVSLLEHPSRLLL